MEDTNFGNEDLFVDPEKNGFYYLLVAVTSSAFVGLISAYLFDEKMGAVIFVQALLSGVASVMLRKGDNSMKKPYIIGDSNEILYLTPEELKERLKKRKSSLHDL